MVNVVKEKINEYLGVLNLPMDVLIINSPYDIVLDYQKKKVWGSANDAGVYIFFSSGEEILYIGHSMNIGQRLGKYFYIGENGSGKPMVPNAINVKWVITIGVNSKYWFLAPSLEYFLIDKFQPQRNKNIRNQLK
jgi:excinuclease UvrABC nuclease subunit